MGTGTQAGKDSAAQSTNDAPKPPAPLIAPTGDGTWDTLAGDINQAAAPFQDLSSPDASDLDKANDVIGGIMGAIFTPLNLLNDGFALLTAPIAKLFPPLPAATLGMLHLGIPHEHDHPPAFPIPLPSFGPVALAGSASVLINGIPAARAGDIGIAITCGTFAPPFEVFTGSSKVFISGARAARMLDITRHCQPGGGWSALAKLAEVGLGLLGVGTEVLGAVTQASDAKKDRDKAKKEADKAKDAADRAKAAKEKVDKAKAALQKAASTPSDGGGSSDGSGGGTPGSIAEMDAQADAADAQMDADDAKAEQEAEAQAQAIADAEAALEEAEEEEANAEQDEADAEELELEDDDAADAADANAKTSAIQAGLDAAAMALGLLMGLDPGLPPCFGLLLTGMPNVLIGGFPMPPWGEVAHGLKKLPKLKNKLKKLKRWFKCDRPGEPIDPVTGACVDESVDYEAPGAPPFRWGRSYSSADAGRTGPMGRGFRHTYEHGLSVDLDRIVYTAPDGSEVELPALGPGGEAIHEGYWVRVRAEGSAIVYAVARPGDAVLKFVRDPRSGAPAKLARMLLLADGDVHEGPGPAPIATVSFAHDALGRLTGMIETRRASVVETRLSLDDRGRIVEVQRGPKGEPAPPRIASYAYDGAGCLVAWQDALGAAGRYAYDAAGRMVRKTDRNGYTFHFAYDAEGRCVEEHGDDGLFRVAMRYDAEARRTVATEHDGAEWVFEYDDTGTVVSIRDPYGAVRDRILDEAGRVVEEVGPGARALTFLYDATGRHDGVEDEIGGLHPPLDRPPLPDAPPSADLPETAREQQWGTALGGAPHAPSFGLDALGRIVEEVGPQGFRRSWGRDATGNVVRHVDRDGREHRTAVTSWNLVGEEIDPLGHRTRYEYTPRGEVARVVDPGGSESRYEHDRCDRVVAVVRHGVTRERYAYDENDRMVEKRDGEGNLLLRRKIDARGLVAERRLASGEVHRFSYDDRGRVTFASSGGVVVRRAFDGQGRLLLDERDGRGVRHRFEGGELRETTTLGRFTVAYRRGPDGALLIEAPAGGVQRIRATPEGVAAELGNGTNAWSWYDEEGRCQGRELRRRREDAVARWSVRYTYSGEGELRRVEDDDRGVTEYAYDAAHRLIGESVASGMREVIVLDAAGNILEKRGLSRVELAEGNRLRAAGRERFGHDGRNHLAEHVDEAGRTTRYRYDSLDMLVGVSWSGHDEVFASGYDALGRRLWKALGKRRTEFYWDGDRLAAEVGPTGALRIYVYAGPAALVPVLFLDYEGVDAAPGSGRAYYPIGNQIGVPLHIEDASGAVVWRAAHVEPHGTVTVHAGARVPYALRFPGHYFDDETGLHYNRYRHYSPRLGRYLQSDPLGQSGGVNLYAYAANPLSEVDVLGLSPLCGIRSWFKKKILRRHDDHETVTPPEAQHPAPEEHTPSPHREGDYLVDPMPKMTNQFGKLGLPLGFVDLNCGWYCEKALLDHWYPEATGGARTGKAKLPKTTKMGYDPSASHKNQPLNRAMITIDRPPDYAGAWKSLLETYGPMIVSGELGAADWGSLGGHKLGVGHYILIVGANSKTGELAYKDPLQGNRLRWAKVGHLVDRMDKDVYHLDRDGARKIIRSFG